MKSEAKYKVVFIDRCPQRTAYPCGLRKEGCSAATPAATPAAGADRVDLSESEQHSSRTIGFTDLGNQQRDGCIDRWDWRGTTKRFPERVADRVHNVSPDRQRIRREPGGHSSSYGNAGSAATSTHDRLDD